MKKLIILLTAICFASCTTIKLPTTKTQFIVERIVVSNDGKTAYYFVHPINDDDLNCNETWFCDTVGVYQKGDKLSFSKTK